MVERVSRVGPSGVRARRAPEPSRVVAVEEGVVAGGIGGQLGSSRSGHSSSGAPLCQRPTIFAPSNAYSSAVSGFGAKVLAVGGDTCVKLRKTM